MQKIKLIRNIREKLLVAEVEEFINNNKYYKIDFVNQNNILTAIIIYEGEEDGREIDGSVVQTAIDSGNKRGRRVKKKEIDLT